MSQQEQRERAARVEQVRLAARVLDAFPMVADGGLTVPEIAERAGSLLAALGQTRPPPPREPGQEG